MLLQQLKLNNIRSYIDETITFPEGSTVLSGDIGCGKSSILLAVEFALFGTSRPDLPAELLLRKGATNGFVELSFVLNNQEIIIKRNLKKEKNGIKQTSGYLIINNVKKELMPVELKAEIINLLGYPEDVISKNKNYLFRYTIYTPQEEMKFILQENEEIRLDALRKIFNIDKYKNIRGNLHLRLKKMRGEIATHKTRLEPLEEQQKKMNEFNQEKKNIVEQLNIILPILKNIEEDIHNKKKETEEFEKEQKHFVDLQNQYKMSTTFLLEKKKFGEEFKIKKEEVMKQINELSLPNEIILDEIKTRIKVIENEKNNLLREKTSMQEKINYLQKKNLNISIN